MAGIDRQRMTQEHMVIHLGTHAVCFPFVLSVDIHTVVDTDHQVLLVDHLPVFYPVSESLIADPRITLKSEGTVSALPAIVLLYQSVGQIEMV